MFKQEKSLFPVCGELMSLGAKLRSLLLMLKLNWQCLGAKLYRCWRSPILLPAAVTRNTKHYAGNLQRHFKQSCTGGCFARLSGGSDHEVADRVGQKSQV